MKLNIVVDAQPPKNWGPMYNREWFQYEITSNDEGELDVHYVHCYQQWRNAIPRDSILPPPPQPTASCGNGCHPNLQHGDYCNGCASWI